MALRSVTRRQALLFGPLRQAACAARAYATGEQQVNRGPEQSLHSLLCVGSAAVLNCHAPTVAGPGCDWWGPRRLCCCHQGRADGHEGHLCRGQGLARWHLPQCGLHPIKGTHCYKQTEQTEAFCSGHARTASKEGGQTWALLMRQCVGAAVQQLLGW